MKTVDSLAYSDPAEEERATTELFFHEYRSELSDLILLLGESPFSTLSEAVEVTQKWTKGDHSDPKVRYKLSGDQEAEAQDIFEKMGLTHEVRLSPGEYDQIIVLGAMQRANNARMDFLDSAFKTGGVSLRGGGSVVLWGGERYMNKDRELPYLEEDFMKTEDVDDVWLRSFRERVKASDTDITETDLLRVAAIRSLGELITTKVVQREQSTDSANYFEMRDTQGHKVVLFDTAAVERPQGQSRHTTEACAEDWLNTLEVPYEARVGFVSSNPYLRRTARVVQNELVKHGRSDIEFVAAGPAAYSTAGNHIFLGEIARNLYEDQEATTKVVS